MHGLILCTIGGALLGADPVATSQLAAINTLLLCFRVLELLGGLRATGAYIAMFFAVTVDIAYFMAILVVFWLQNGFSLQLLYGGAESLPDALWKSFNMMFVSVPPPLPLRHTRR